MRQKKIRGHNRIHKQIEGWRKDDLQLDLDYLNEVNRIYVKILVHPFCDLTITNSQIPFPKGQTKLKILSALLDIYDSWKKQLDEIKQPYYLKIWLFENRFSKSQVVCAVGDMLNFYENTFYKPSTQILINRESYGQLKDRIGNYSWEMFHDEDHYSNDEVGEPEMYKTVGDYNDYKRWFEKIMKKKHRTEQLSEKIGNAYASYLFYRGKVWVGGK